MKFDSSPRPNVNRSRLQDPEPAWNYVVWFGVLGVLAGGAAVYSYAQQGMNRPPLPPEVHYCGLSGIGVLFYTYIGTPVAAVVSGSAGCLFGGMLDYVIHWKRQR